MAGLKIKKGDRIQVLTGKDRGKTGQVTRALPEVRKVIVDGVNVAKKHQKATRATMQGGIIDKDMPIAVSNVMILCDKCGPTRIAHRFDDEGTKRRVCVKCEGDL